MVGRRYKRGSEEVSMRAHSDFKLPDRVLGKPPMKQGPLAGVTLDIERERKRYFRRMQWSYRTGRPSQKKLVELGLEDLVEDIY